MLGYIVEPFQYSFMVRALDRVRARRGDVSGPGGLRHYARAGIHGRRAGAFGAAGHGCRFPAGDQPLLCSSSYGNPNRFIHGFRRTAHGYQRGHFHRHHLCRHVCPGPGDAFQRRQHQRQHRRFTARPGAWRISNGRLRFAGVGGGSAGGALRVPPSADIHHLRPRGGKGGRDQDWNWWNTCF